MRLVWGRGASGGGSGGVGAGDAGVEDAADGDESGRARGLGRGGGVSTRAGLVRSSCDSAERNVLGADNPSSVGSTSTGGESGGPERDRLRCTGGLSPVERAGPSSLACRDIV